MSITLYQFCLSFTRENNVQKPIIEKHIYEAEEKPKSYQMEKQEYRSPYYYSRVLKSDIGKPTGYNNKMVYLLEDDKSRAIDILLQPYLSDKKMYLEKINEIDSIVAALREEQMDAPASAMEIDFLNHQRHEQAIPASLIAEQLNMTTQEYLDIEEKKKTMPQDLYQIAVAYLSYAKHANK